MSNSFSEVLLKTLESLRGINFNNLWMYFLGYIGFIWILTCVWVFFDAKRRYNNQYVIWGITILVAVCNFPVLVLYVMLRPEHTKDELGFIQEGLINLFIKQGKLLNSPESSTVSKLEETKEFEQKVEIPENNFENRIKSEEFLKTEEHSTVSAEDQFVVETSADDSNFTIETQNKIAVTKDIEEKRNIKESVEIIKDTIGSKFLGIAQFIKDKISFVKTVQIDYSEIDSKVANPQTVWEGAKRNSSPNKSKQRSKSENKNKGKSPTGGSSQNKSQPQKIAEIVNRSGKKNQRFSEKNKAKLKDFKSQTSIPANTNSSQKEIQSETSPNTEVVPNKNLFFKLPRRKIPPIKFVMK